MPAVMHHALIESVRLQVQVSAGVCGDDRTCGGLHMKCRVLRWYEFSRLLSSHVPVIACK